MSFRNEKYPNVFKILLIINSALSTPPIKTAFVKYEDIFVFLKKPIKYKNNMGHTKYTVETLKTPGELLKIPTKINKKPAAIFIMNSVKIDLLYNNLEKLKE